MFDVGPRELLIVAALALLFFGPTRLPEMGKSIGEGIREFKRSLSAPLEGAERIGDEKKPAS